MSIERETMNKVMWRILPYICLLFFIAFIDRVNVGFAALRMNEDLGMSSTAYGIGAGMFFIGYFFFEVPSNMLLKKVGVQVTVARIMVLWGFLAAGTAFIQTPTQFYILRFLIGAAEAGFTPAMLYYLTTWFPTTYRARAVALFLMMMPVSSTIGAPLSTWIMTTMDGVLNHHGWQWMFVLEALPAIILGFTVLKYLPGAPTSVHWLTEDQKYWLSGELAAESNVKEKHLPHNLLAAIANRRTLKLILVLGGSVFGMYGAGFWIAQIVKTFGHTDQVTGLLSAIPYLFACFGMVLWSKRSDAARERIWHMVVPVWLAAGGFFTAYFVLGNPVLAMVALTVSIVGIFSVFPVFWATTSVLYTSSATAVGIAAINSCANLTGYVAPMVVGVLKDLTGSFNSPMIALGIALFLAGVGALLLRKDLRQALAGGERQSQGKVQDAQVLSELAISSKS